MDRFDVIKFEDLTGPKGGDWVRIGGGSFGVVFRGEYLGTEVAIKEVLPNDTYDVEKYFERECVLMKEARHPNIVQYIGLTKSPGSNGHIYIISEFVGPNLRALIADENKPFDWPLRISFATDIARAVAYLHARNCLHRDLKGENLLVTDNQRIKICDFGFARIAARNEEEMRRISYCGTDGYMSPEILLGVDFGLPSDIFSLGVIFCEIISRHLVDSHTFKRQMPTFGLDSDEIREMADIGCHADFIQLCIDMTKAVPEERPEMRQVLRRLRIIEQEIVARESAKGTLTNVGSVRGESLAALLASKGSKAAKRPNTKRLPSFEGQINTNSLIRQRSTPIKEESHDRNSSESGSDDDVEEALEALEMLAVGNGKTSELITKSLYETSTLKFAGHGNPWWDNSSGGTLPSLPASWMRSIPGSSRNSVWRDHESCADQREAGGKAKDGEYSISVVCTSRNGTHTPLSASLSRMTGHVHANGSTITVKNRTPLNDLVSNVHSEKSTREENQDTPHLHSRHASNEDAPQSFMTARTIRQTDCDGKGETHHGEPSFAMATIASSSIYEEASTLYHRFTLVKNGTRRPPTIGTDGEIHFSTHTLTSRLPAQLILANALTKCNVCSKRLGFGSYMDCDDCPYKTHVSCADLAEPNCQEMHIPTGSDGTNTPGTPPVGRQASQSPSFSTPSAKDGATSIATPQSVSKRESAKSPPSSLSKGVALFRRRNSKSPPPAKGNMLASVRS